MFNNLIVLSYNIWFNTYLWRERTEAFIKKIRGLNPHFVCLQEVRSEVFNVLRTSLSEYHFITQDISVGYFCVIMSRFPPRETEDYAFASSMGRSLLVGWFPLGDGHEVVVANTHFESVFHRQGNPVKIDQFKTSEDILEKILRTSSNVIFCMDSNVLDIEESQLLGSWCDSWKLKGNDANKFTYDGKKNKYLTAQNVPYQSRLDRILFKCINWKVSQYQMLDNPRMEISDHFGVCATFRQRT